MTQFLSSTFVLFLFSTFSFASDFPNTLDCEFYFNNKVVMTAKTNCNLNNEVAESTEVNGAGINRTLPNINNDLQGNELYNFSATDDPNEDGIVIRVFDEAINGSSTIYKAKTKMPLLRELDGQCTIH